MFETSIQLLVYMYIIKLKWFWNTKKKIYLLQNNINNKHLRSPFCWFAECKTDFHVLLYAINKIVNIHFFLVLVKLTLKIEYLGESWLVLLVLRGRRFRFFNRYSTGIRHRDNHLRTYIRNLVKSSLVRFYYIE